MEMHRGTNPQLESKMVIGKFVVPNLTSSTRNDPSILCLMCCVDVDEIEQDDACMRAKACYQALGKFPC